MSSPKVETINAANFTNITSVSKDYRYKLWSFAAITVIMIPTTQTRLLENILTMHRLNALAVAITVHWS